MAWFAFGERDKSALDKMLPCRDNRLSWNTEVITYPCSGTGKGHLPETLVAFIHKNIYSPKRFTRSIRNFSAKKAFTPSHRARFCLIYNGFECEGLDFQVFTSTVAFYRVYLLIFGWFSGVKAYAFHPSQAFTARVNALLPMWTLWNQNLHARINWISEGNGHYVNGWIHFSGN